MLILRGIISTTVRTHRAKKLPYLYDIIVQNSRYSRLEQAKIV